MEGSFVNRLAEHCLFSVCFCVLIATGARGADSSRSVRVEICEEGLADKDVWPEEFTKANESFDIPAFGLDRIPAKYDDDGVRGTRPSPSLVRLWAMVDIPAGKHRMLIRARSASRLWIDGNLIVETQFAPNYGGDGSQNPERLVPLDLGRGFRFAPRGEYEAFAEFDAAGGVVEVKFELFAGGREGTKPRRVELGESVVAIQKAGSESWELMTPDAEQVIPYTDQDWNRYRQKVTAIVAGHSEEQRASHRDKNAEYWTERRRTIDRYLAALPHIAVPPLPDRFTASNPIDHFVAAKFAEVCSQNHPATASKIDFFRDVRPLLESRCAECHRGVHAKGGLRLDSGKFASQGGDSGAAYEPGNADNSELFRRVSSHDDGEMMPPNGKRLAPSEIGVLKQWIAEGAPWPQLPLVRESFAPPVDDAGFLRRAMLDTVGVPPTLEELKSFVADPSPRKRAVLINRLLEDDRWADHWMPFWQDILAENPNILNPTLNNTGPFRWWLYESMLDDVPVDRMVTQLILQRGGEREGGPAGFSIASQNDVPFAAKGAIVSSAFLGVDLKCARCHDSPTGEFKQEQLFQLGAMIAANPLNVPKTSSVDPAKLHAGGRTPLIAVTLQPGSTVQPAWPFSAFVEPEASSAFVRREEDHRERLAALITVPQNERFAQVVTNRIWQRFMGRGIVEPLDDWEKGQPTHPELLQWLSREFVRSGYQMKAVARLIMNSDAYQRAVDPMLREPDPLYSASEPRRLIAEQVVDSLFAVTGKPSQTEPMCLDLNGRRETENALDLGLPQRAWMLASLSNERDRPSLTLPRLQAVSDVMSALGWRGARQDPASTRDTSPNALQPAIIANGVMSVWLTRLSDDHGLTELALQEQTVDALVDAMFLRLLSRSPTSSERERYVSWLAEGFNDRRVTREPVEPAAHVPPKLITWSNHLLPESDRAANERIEDARSGDPPTLRLEPTWRARCEDVIWALINSPEMLYRP